MFIKVSSPQTIFDYDKNEESCEFRESCDAKLIFINLSHVIRFCRYKEGNGLAEIQYINGSMDYVEIQREGNFPDCVEVR